MSIKFNRPHMVGKELEYVRAVLNSSHLAGDGNYTGHCQQWIEETVGCSKALLTHSCTAALEMSAILADLKPGDEVIMPSYTFVSTANAFVLRGAMPVFVDISPDTMNIDPSKIESAVTKKTKAIVPVHYAGVGCEMDAVNSLAEEYGLLVIEDAAQGIMCTYRDKPLGSIGHFGTLSFHETKNITSGEGGAILINDERFVERAEIIREKGTNRSKYFRGQVDKYSWVDLGSSYLPSEILAAVLYAQMEEAFNLTEQRLKLWSGYYRGLKPLEDKELIKLPFIPPYCNHNAHMFYIKTGGLEERSALIRYLQKYGISAVFHYVPLHSSEAGKRFSRFSGEDIHTTVESEKILRLPISNGLSEEDLSVVVEKVSDYYSSK